MHENNSEKIFDRYNKVVLALLIHFLPFVCLLLIHQTNKIPTRNAYELSMDLHLHPTFIPFSSLHEEQTNQAIYLGKMSSYFSVNLVKFQATKIFPTYVF